MFMRVDMRMHQGIRAQVHAGLSALRVQSKQLWPVAWMFSDTATGLMLQAGDLSRLAHATPASGLDGLEAHAADIKTRLGGILLRTIRGIDELGFDVLECLDLAIEAREKFEKKPWGAK